MAIDTKTLYLGQYKKAEHSCKSIFNYTGLIILPSKSIKF